MTRILLYSVLILALRNSMVSQEVLTLQPGAADGKDSEVYSLQPNSNYVSDLLRGAAWTFGGEFGVERGLFEFDLSSIPAGSVIDSAFLFLFSPDAPTTQDHSGDNESYLVRITEAWNESTVTWDNQPSFTFSNAVELPESVSNLQDYTHIDVTRLVEDMVADPSNSHGFMILLAIEDIYRRISFVSSDYANESKHPKLVVHYTPPTCYSLFLQPNAVDGKDCEVYSLEPNSNYVSDLLRGATWTFGGNVGIERGLFSFDLSSISSQSDIIIAYLSLYSPDVPSTQAHSGDNDAYLQRITSDWNENTVTWNNQPSTSSLNQVILSQSNEEYQDYENINVTDLVQDMVSDPANSFGFLIRLVNEDIYRRMGFCSSDYPNPDKHPSLEICYSPPVAVDPIENDHVKVDLYPNPSHDQLSVKIEGRINPSQIELIDHMGRIVMKESIKDQKTLSIKHLTPSMYFVRILDDSNIMVYSGRIVKL